MKFLSPAVRGPVSAALRLRPWRAASARAEMLKFLGPEGRKRTQLTIGRREGVPGGWATRHSHNGPLSQRISPVPNRTDEPKKKLTNRKNVLGCLIMFVYFAFFLS